MTTDVFEQLAEVDVPPTPAQFDAQLHERVNRWLIVGHALDLLLRGLPFALLHFSRAAVGLVAYTLTGRYDADPKNKRRHRRT
jgi:hypothetical protein